ncbi:hypothetical protein E3Q22_01775 [Wallemia mellicola]|uniref:CBS domain-containing protein n=1 Tax=Wallemia mellicola TaxID=1708541 RepID=A0A4T0MCB5_9BASI|nr:hypothetical protein E3Q22_01775 [Wallemia mellicola]
MTHTYTTKMIWRSFFCALAATAMLSALNPFQTSGKLVLFQVTYDKNWHFFEIIYFISLGIFGGLFGSLVIKLNMLYVGFRRRHLSENGISEAVILALITSVICYPNPFLRTDMTESMSILFRECGGREEEDFGVCDNDRNWSTINSTLLATIVRTVLLIITYGAQVPAGIFVPSLAIGATFGRLVGTISKMLYQANPSLGIFSECNNDMNCITPGTYALLGSAATLSGVMRIWVTVPIIIFELTGALTYILPTMIVLITTKAISDFLSGGEAGIADQMIKFNQMPVLTREDEHYFNVDISSVMTRDVVVIEEEMLVRDVDSVLLNAHSGYPIVNNREDMKLVGYVDAGILSQSLASIPGLSQQAVLKFSNKRTIFDADAEPDQAEYNLNDTVNDIPMTISPTTSLDVVMKLFKKIGPSVILIAKQGVVEGIVTVKDVLRETEMIKVGNERAISATKASITEDLIDFWNKFKQRLINVQL